MKVRYFRARLPCTIPELGRAIRERRRPTGTRVTVLSANTHELVVRLTIVRLLMTREILDDGSEKQTSVPTMDQYSLRVFEQGESTFIALLDPPRGGGVVTDFLRQALGDVAFSCEPVELSAELIRAHIARFDVAKLVSAKVRDFHVYGSAIGRLEISSKEGLLPAIAPFLEGRHFKVDSLSYEISHEFVKGLIHYSNNGTLRVSSALVQAAFPKFELVLS